MGSDTFSLALVTGATSGIGRAVAKLVAKRGIDLIATGRDAAALDALKGSLAGSRGRVDTIAIDLCDHQQRHELSALIRARAPDLIINSAGLGFYGPILDHTADQVRDTVEVNISALLEVTLEGARALVAAGRPGTIVNLSSAAAFFLPFPHFSVYAVSKVCVNALSASLDAEWRPHGIRVLAACPGQVATDFRRRAGGSTPPKGKIVMTAEFAAEEIWRQIIRGKPLHTFDWHYRVARVVAAALPRRWLAALLRSGIDSR